MGKQIRFKPGWLLAILIGVNAALGWFLAPDFGRTPDENIESLRASAALRAYSPGSFGKYSDNQIDPISRFYGTAMSSLAYGFEALLQEPTGAEPGVLVHYAYFLIFQAGVAALYFLCRKFAGEWAALGAAVLFATQPYLFGHAFNNPKDIPLLAVFLAVVTAGFYMVDAVSGDSQEEKENAERDRFDLGSAWGQLPKHDRTYILRLLWVWPALLGLWAASFYAVPAVVDHFYYAPADTWAGALFQSVVGGNLQVDVDLYRAKTRILTDRVFMIGGAAAVIGVAALTLRRFYSLRRALVKRAVEPLLKQLAPAALLKTLVDWRVVLAGAVWGLAIATRSVALFAGGVVGLYCVLVVGKRAVRPMLAYTIWAGVVTYLAFPQLWVGGFSRLIQGLLVLSKFPWPGKVYYQGEVFAASALPRGYLPFFLTVKYTEPALILIAIGVWAAARRWRTAGRRWRTGLAVCLLWFALPVLQAVLTQSVLYDSARQYLFVLPLFVLGAIGIDQAFRWSGRRWLQIVLAVVMVAPGIVSMVQLHPYQYVYYNSLVGGVSGAARDYTVDYWSASATEAIRYVNAQATDGAQVVFSNIGALNAAEIFAREDLTLVLAKDRVELIGGDEYWIVTRTGINDGLLDDPAAERVYTIERAGVILGVVLKPSGDPGSE
jgi:hypothetical protein